MADQTAELRARLQSILAAIDEALTRARAEGRREGLVKAASWADQEYHRFAVLEAEKPRSPRASKLRREGHFCGRLEALAQMAAHCRALAKEPDRG